MRNILSISKQAVIYFFIILFVYAAVSKLTDFENFQVQVAQSPLLSAFATFIAYATVIGELIIALMLCFTKSRLLGLYLFLGFMTAFTVYIFLILNYSPFVPCSCGGVLEKMGWWEHLWFNVIISLLAATNILHNNITKRTILYTIGTIIVSTAIVVLLFISSENIMKMENPFVRRFLPHPITDVKGLELPYNSYYIAGYSNGHFYLGNHTAPLHGLIINTEPEITDTVTLKMLDIHKYNFSSVQWSLQGDSIMLHDHALGAFYHGQSTNSIITKSYFSDTLIFSQAVFMNNSQYVLRTYNDNRDNVNLSIFSTKFSTLDKKENLLNEEGLSPDLFSNDGILLYNNELKKIIYVFYYKNKVFHFDSDLEKRQVLQTIDTITKPNFSVKLIQKKQQLKRSENAVIVNKMASTAGDYIFIASDRIGKNEQKEMYNVATIIDVYSISKNTYEYSFYFYHYKDTPISEFKIFENYIIGTGKNTVSVAKFKKSIYE